MIFKIFSYSHILFTVLLFNINEYNANKLNNPNLDSVIESLLSSDFIQENSEEKNDFNEVDELVFSDGLWKCGNCTDIERLNLVYNERNEFETNNYNAQEEIQVGLSIENVRCIAVETDRAGRPSIAAGRCLGGDGVTMKFDKTKYCEIYVYS